MKRFMFLRCSFYVMLLSLLTTNCGRKNNLMNDHINPENRAWPDGAQIVLKMHSSVPEEFKESIAEALNKQNSILVKTSVVLDGDSKKNGFDHNPTTFSFEDVLHDDINAIYFTSGDLPSTSDNGSPDAITQTWFTGEEIGGGDIIFKTDKIKSKEQVEVVMLHEVGHLLGLHHNSDNQEDIMYPVVNIMMLKDPYPSSYCKELHKRYETKDCPF